MENFNNNIPNPSPKARNKPHNENEFKPSFKGRNKPNSENEFKSPSNKNFMSPTISAAIKAKKILGEKNETIDAKDAKEQRFCNFGSKSLRSDNVVVESDDDVEKDIAVDKPYDPVNNYLSPRPKFLRYNPNRRRKILNLQENDDDNVKISTYFDGGVSSSSVPLECCDQRESVAEAEVKDVSVEEDEDGENGEEDEDEVGEEDEEEMVEFGEEGSCCSLKGFFKILFVVIALIVTTQAICSMNSPLVSETVESGWGVNDWGNHVYGSNFSEVEYGLIREPNFLVGSMKKVDDFYDIEEFVMVQDAESDDCYYDHQDEIQADDSNVIQDAVVQDAKIDEYVHQDEVLQEQDLVEHDINQDGLTEEYISGVDESIAAESEVSNEMEDGVEEVVDDIKTDDVDEANAAELEMTSEMEEGVEEEVDDVKTDDADEANAAELEMTNEMEDGVEEEVDDVKSNDVLIKVTSFDTAAVVVFIGHILILTSFSVVYYLMKGKKKPSVSVIQPVEKEDIKDLEPSTDSESLIQHKEEVAETPLQNDVSEANIPSVELLGEFVFGEEQELTSNNISTEENILSSNSLIQTSAYSYTYSQTKSYQMEMSTGDSHTAKKQRRKTVEVVTPSPVRRSSRLKSRTIKSP